MSASRTRKLQQALAGKTDDETPQDIVIEGVTVVYVEKTPPETIDELIAAPAAPPSEEGDVNASVLAEERASEAVWDAARAASPKQEEPLSEPTIVGRTGEPLDDEFVRDLARLDPELAGQFGPQLTEEQAAIVSSAIVSSAIVSAGFDAEVADETIALLNAMPPAEPEPTLGQGRQRTLPDELPQQPDSSDQLLQAAVQQATDDAKPKRPIGLWVAWLESARTDPLSRVSHLAVPSKPAGLGLVGGIFATPACGGPAVMVDKAIVMAPDFGGDTQLARCGWCERVAQGETIADYDRGKRRPVLPGQTDPPARRERRSATRIASEASFLTGDAQFKAALARVGATLARTDPDGIERFVMDGESLRKLLDEMQTVTVANTQREVIASTARRETAAAQSAQAATLIANRPAEPARAPRSTRNARSPKPTVEGTSDQLPDQRTLGGRQLVTLFRTVDPIGPFLIGRARKIWTARDMRTNTDTPFGKDKAAAIAFARQMTQAAGLSVSQLETYRLQAQQRTQANDPSYRRAR